MAKLSDVILRDIATNRPAAGTPGRLFYDTTNSLMYRDNGSTWDNVEGGGTSGFVTSVAMTVPSWLSVSGSPITTSGTLAVTAAGAQTANQVLATPDGSSGAAGLRALANGDLPTVNVAHGGTGATSFTTSKLIGSDSSSSTGVLRALSIAGGLTLSGTTVTSTTTYNNAWASTPSSPVSGDLWYPSDASIGFRYDGSAWVPLVANGKLVQSSFFSWVNQGSATVSDSGGGVYLHDPAETSDSFRALVKSAPATPYSLIIHWRPNLQHVNYSGAAVFFRNSSNGKVQMAAFNSDTSLYNFAGTQGTLATSSWTFSANAFTRPGPTFYPFIKLRDDGTNLIISTSPDGQNWEQVYSSGRTTFITSGPDQIGFAVESRNTASLPAGILMLSWNEIAG